MTGLCECGCGQPTSLIEKSNAAKGLVRGQYRRFATGHSVRARWLNHVKPEPKPPRVSGPDYVVDDETGCWVWQRGKTTGGYAVMYVGKPKRQTYGHRWYWQQKHGPIPDDLQIDHLCRNRACVNPDHLELVTGAENVRRGLGAKRLPDSAVAEIMASDLSSRELGARFGVSHSYIQSIRNGTHWSVAA